MEVAIYVHILVRLVFLTQLLYVRNVLVDFTYSIADVLHSVLLVQH